MSLFQWPFFRKTYPGINNPRFVDDVLASNQGVMDGIMALIGNNATDFFIVSGLDYTPGAPGTYTAGFVLINGVLYFIPAVMTEGLYIAPSPTDTMLQPFTDGVSRNIYTLNQAASSNTVAAGNSPIFGGNMNQYRVGNKYLSTNMQTVLTTIASLGAAAFSNIGSVAGTVAAGNDSRFGYTVAQINEMFALIANVLTLTNTTAFTPSGPFQPATKKYVDDNSAGRLFSGSVNVGTVVSGGALYTASFGTTLAISNYKISHSVRTTDLTNRAGGIDCIFRNLTTSSFDVWVYPQISGFINVFVDYILWTP